MGLTGDPTDKMVRKTGTDADEGHYTIHIKRGISTEYDQDLEWSCGRSENWMWYDFWVCLKLDIPSKMVV